MANNYLKANVQWVRGPPNTHLHWTVWHSRSSRRPPQSMTTCQVELRRFCVDICRLSLSWGSSFSSAKITPLFTKTQSPVQNEVFCFHNSLFCVTLTNWNIFQHVWIMFLIPSFFYPQWDVLICPDWWGWKQAVWLLSPITGMHLKCRCPLSLASLNFIFPYYELAYPVFVVFSSKLSLIISYFLNLVAKIMDFFPPWM